LERREERGEKKRQEWMEYGGGLGLEEKDITSWLE